MQKLLVIMVFLCGVATMNGQSTPVKNSYVEKGDVIEAKIYFDSGQLSQTGFYTKDGKLTGSWVSFNRKGEKTAVANYDRGVKVGKWFFWNNETLTEVDYDNSKIAAVNVWKNKDTQVVSNK